MLKIHHIGYAARALEPTLETFRRLGYEVQGPVVTDEARHVRLVFLRLGAYVVELVSPADPRSPVSDLLQKKGDGPYHICYETTGRLEEEIDRLARDGFKVVSAAAAAPAIDGRRVAFLFGLAGGLIELVEPAAAGGQK